MKFTHVLPVSCLATLALSATVDVTVGPGLSYSPSSVTAAQGDVIRFKFGSGHNVVSGKFNSPCQPDGMIYSGSPREGDTFSVTLNSTDPVWIYCSIRGHCEGGMAMVINAPSNQNINAYKQAAASVSSSNTPDRVTGGVLNAQAASSSSMSSMSSASGSSMMATGTSTASQPAATTSRSAASNALGSSTSAIGVSFMALAAALGLTM